MPNIITIANQKGGVGKTTTTFNLGVGLQKEGKQVLLIDLDPQANLSSYLGYEPDELPTITDLFMQEVHGKNLTIEKSIRTHKEQVNYIPADIQLSSSDYFLMNAMAREQILQNILSQPHFENYDYIIIDCLPSLGVLLLNALTASNQVLIPVQAQKFALDGLELVLDAVNRVRKMLNPKLQVAGILTTMKDNTNMAQAVEQELRDRYKDFVFETVISKSVTATNSSFAQESLLSSNNKLGGQYHSLAKEFLVREVNKHGE